MVTAAFITLMSQKLIMIMTKADITSSGLENSIVYLFKFSRPTNPKIAPNTTVIILKVLIKLVIIYFCLLFCR